ncbi:hypothetical protein FRC17_001042 [Serendipita sp. 399]|nr:hypothetical protein FRC17_001042 [Serendipita sp. 399]
MILPLGFNEFGQSAEILLGQCKALQTIQEVMRRRMELDTQYIEGLNTIVGAYNEAESNEVVDGLLTPLITQLKQEIDLRTLANKDTNALLASLPDINELQQDISVGSVDLVDAKESYRAVIEAENAVKALLPLDLPLELRPLPDEGTLMS